MSFKLSHSHSWKPIQTVISRKKKKSSLISSIAMYCSNHESAQFINKYFNSFLAGGDFCHLLIIFASSFGPRSELTECLCRTILSAALHVNVEITACPDQSHRTAALCSVLIHMVYMRNCQCVYETNDQALSYNQTIIRLM